MSLRSTTGEYVLLRIEFQREMHVYTFIASFFLHLAAFDLIPMFMV